MNYSEIQSLKATLTNLVKQGSSIKVPGYGIDGKVVGVGFKPYWSNPADSKIEKIEFNIMDSFGRVIPFNFYYVTGYEVLSSDNKRIEDSKNISLNIHVYSPNKSRDIEPIEKIQVDLINGTVD